MLSRGLKLNPTEQNRIAPILAVFASLFGYSLVTIHDTEFYGDANPVKNAKMMPFSLPELVSMSLLLRDVSLGLVELAFPDSRPSIQVRKKIL